MSRSLATNALVDSPVKAMSQENMAILLTDKGLDASCRAVWSGAKRGCYDL